MVHRFTVGQLVTIHGAVCKLIGRANTTGSWKIDRRVRGSSYWNESEMTSSVEKPPAKPKNSKAGKLIT